MWLKLKVRENSPARYVYYIKHVAFSTIKQIFKKPIVSPYNLYNSIPSKYKCNDIKRLLHKKGKTRSELKKGPKTS